MGHRSYLYLTNKDKEELDLFEANNSLPFFWLTLIDSKTFNNKVKEWEAFISYESNHTEEEVEKYFETYSLNIQIPIENFKRNSFQGGLFIEKFYPETIDLYKEFLELIERNFKNNQKLEIDIFQLSAFEEALNEFTKPIVDSIKNIEELKLENVTFLNTDDLIATGTGFVSVFLEEGSELSLYQKAIENRRKTEFKYEKRDVYVKQELIIFIIILLICPVFTFITFKGFKKEGFSFMVIFIGILNMLFYVFSFGGIKSQIKSYKELKKANNLAINKEK